MRKLSMKKAGMPAIEPPSASGSDGVSAEGEGARVLGARGAARRAFAGAARFAAVLRSAARCGWPADASRWGSCPARAAAAPAARGFGCAGPAGAGARAAGSRRGRRLRAPGAAWSLRPARSTRVVLAASAAGLLAGAARARTASAAAPEQHAGGSSQAHRVIQLPEQVVEQHAARVRAFAQGA